MKKKMTIIKTIAIISTVLVVAGCSTVPNNEICQRIRSVKSAVTSRQGQNLRPIYDQIREHVKKRTLRCEGFFLIEINDHMCIMNYINI